MKKYNRADIMKRAHEIRKSGDPKPTMGDALCAAWGEAKKGEPVKTAQSLFKVRALLAKLEAEEAALLRPLSPGSAGRRLSRP